jgi:hypothetical protein
MQRLLHLHRVHEFRTRAEIARKQQKSAQAGFGHHHQTHEAAAAAAYAQAAAVAKGRNPLQSPDSEVLRSGLATAQAPPKHAISSVARELSMINHVDETADPADRLSMLLMQIKLGSGMRSGLNLPLKGGSSGGESPHAKFEDVVAQTPFQFCYIYIYIYGIVTGRRRGRLTQDQFMQMKRTSLCLECFHRTGRRLQKTVLSRRLAGASRGAREKGGWKTTMLL